MITVALAMAGFTAERMCVDVDCFDYTMGQHLGFSVV